MAQDPWGAKALGQALAMATNMAAALAVGYFLGAYLDKRFGTGPWLTVLGFILGTGTGLKMVYEMAFGKTEEPVKKGVEKRKIRRTKDDLEKIKEVRDRLLMGQDPEDKDQEGPGPR